MIKKCSDPPCSNLVVIPTGVWAVFPETVNSNEEKKSYLLIGVTL